MDLTQYNINPGHVLFYWRLFEVMVLSAIMWHVLNNDQQSRQKNQRLAFGVIMLGINMAAIIFIVLFTKNTPW